MALADFAGGVQDELQRLLLERLAAQKYADAQKQQEFQNQRQVKGDARAQQALDMQGESTRLLREQQAAAQASAERQRLYSEANTLGDQLPPATFLPERDPAVATMQQGGRGALLTPQEPGMGAMFQGPMPTGETPESVAHNRPRGFLKTMSAKQQEDARSYADKQADNARAEAQATETARHNQAMEAAAAGKPDDFSVWQKKYDYEVSHPKPEPVRSFTSTGQQKAALGFFNRMLEAEKNARAVEDKLSPSDVGVQAYAPAFLENWLQSPEGQAYTQAQRTFTEARLRKESGAAIPTHEYTNDRQTNFRVAGDSPENITQKRKARLALLKGLAAAAGPVALQEFYGPDSSMESILKDFADTPKTVRMVDPRGRVLDVPADKVSELEAAGARRQ